jgi:type II secretory pathway component HofQ
VEAQVSKLAADAAQRLTATNQQQAAAQQAQQQAQDPVVQMQQRQLELDTKSQQDKMQVEMAKIASQEKIAQLNIEARHMSQEDKDRAQGVLKGFTSSVELQKQEAELAVRREELSKRGDDNDKRS